MTTTTSTTTLDDGTGVVRVEDVFTTDIDDLWEACTTPDRLARWIAVVSGDPCPGATVEAVFTSSWSGPIRIEVCDAPRHLVLTSGVGTDEETTIDAVLTVVDGGTRLTVEERGLQAGHLAAFGAGWRVHLEDLAQSLDADGVVHAGGWSSAAPAPAWLERWKELSAGT